MLWHASDDPNIEIFHPHRAPTSTIDEPLVWAVDEEHVPAYWFPRDCPRATFWIGPNTTIADAAWMNGAQRVHAIEWDWWSRFRDARIHLYRMPADTFEVMNAGAGYHVSRVSVEPIERITVDDLVAHHARAGIELRIVPNLWPLWDRVTSSTLSFSGIRLRNATPPLTTSTSYALLP